MKSRLAVLFGGVADQERKHLGKKASGIRGARAPGRRIDLAFLGRLAFGPSPIGALGLGRLARGTEPRPMVPTDSRVAILPIVGSDHGPIEKIFENKAKPFIYEKFWFHISGFSGLVKEVWSTNFVGPMPFN